MGSCLINYIIFWRLNLQSKFSFVIIKPMRYVQDLIKSTIKTERVEGFKKLAKAKLCIPRVKIINNQAFLIYKKSGMIQPLRKEIEAVFFYFKKNYPRRAFYVGRAYSVPGFENPPGPYSIAKTAAEMVQGVIKLYDFAVENNYDQKKAKIGVIIHPWINPKAPLGGGCVVLSEDHFKKIIIEAIFGLDEGVQSLPHDIYLADFFKNKILEKIVVKKEECLETDKNFNVQTVRVAKKWQKMPVLKNKDILQVVNDFRRFNKIFGPHRIEFALEVDGLYYRECIPFVLKKEKFSFNKIRGRVKRVASKKDLKNINKKIIFIDPLVVKKREFNFLTYLATNMAKNTVILYPGSASTGHAATIFREGGHLVVFVSSQTFRNGEKVIIEAKNGEPLVKRE